MRKRSPLLSDQPHELLDHVEFCALTDPDRNSSESQLASELTLTGSQDAIVDDESDINSDDSLEGILDAAFTEAEYRIQACGEAFYPFSLEGKALLSNDESLSTVYTFLLFLSIFGEKAVAGQNGAKLFEDVCSYAVATYLGCYETPAESHVFGFPRRVAPKGFVGALEDLCHTKIREGLPDTRFPDIHTMKDAGLDIVAWLPFPDRRSAKLIAFGQCATGADWWGKRNELQPGDWVRTWLTKTPQVTPMKMFLVPHAIGIGEWAKLGFAAGVIFDRFRITHFAERSISESLRVDVQHWSNAAWVDKA